MFSNSYVKWRLRYVMLRFVGVQFQGVTRYRQPTWFQETTYNVHPATLLQLCHRRAGTTDAAEGAQGEKADRAALTADCKAHQGSDRVQARYHRVYRVGLLLPQLDQEVKGL